MNITFRDGFAIVKNSPKNAWSKEPEEAWIDRVLSIPPQEERGFRPVGGTEVDLLLGEEKIRLFVAPQRVRVLRSLIRTKKNGDALSRHRKGDGAGVIFVDPEGSGFLLTRKDDLHPNARCRGKLSLVSGSLDPGESFEEGISREICEEIKRLGLVDLSLISMCEEDHRTIPCVQWPGEYRMSVFTVYLDDFSGWKNAWLYDGLLSEGNPAFLSMSEAVSLFERERADPGCEFVASHHLALERHLR